MNSNQEDYKLLPAVSKLLALPEVKSLLCIYGKALITFSVRHTLSFYREKIRKGSPPPTNDDLCDKISSLCKLFAERSLKKVLNATGVIIHTNLGRAPLGGYLLTDATEILKGYNNLEFDLLNGVRGQRDVHAAGLLKFLTGAEDVLIVNNNAAAVMLILRSFAKGREVVISRGELVEIGGSFRIPDIMAASDCKMVEVGTTNKTKTEDYIRAINENTSILFKAHKSNYIIKGFTEDVGLSELVKLGKKNKIPVVYDLGSGLLKKSQHPVLANEPDVKSSLDQGVDLVCFSSDKLLGGPQAGIIAGRKTLIDKLKKEPMLRALRVCKITLALLETACTYYLNDKALEEKNMILKILDTPKDELLKNAELLKKFLNEKGINSEISSTKGQTGGGTLPDAEIESFGVVIKNVSSNKLRSGYAEMMYHELLQQPLPVLGILKQGNIVFDVLTLYGEELEKTADIISCVHQHVINKQKENKKMDT